MGVEGGSKPKLDCYSQLVYELAQSCHGDQALCRRQFLALLQYGSALCHWKASRFDLAPRSPHRPRAMKSILRAKLRVASAAFRRLVNQAFAFRRTCGRGSECCARGEFSPRGGLLFFGRDPGRHSWLAYWRGSVRDALMRGLLYRRTGSRKELRQTRLTAAATRTAVQIEKATLVSGGPRKYGGR